MTVPWFVGAGLLVGLAATAANADETPTRVFHIGIVSGTPRSHPANVAFEDRLRELGYIEGRNLTIDFVWGDDTDRMAEAVGELAHRGVDVILPAGQQAVLTAAFTASAARSPPCFQGGRCRSSSGRLHEDSLLEGSGFKLGVPRALLSPTARPWSCRLVRRGAGFRVDTLVQIDAAHLVSVCGVSGVIVYSIRLFPPFPLEIAGTRI